MERPIEIHSLTKENAADVLVQLRKNGVRNSWAIQDITVWPDSSKFYYTTNESQFSYLLLSGHPATHGQTTIVADGDSTAVSAMLKNVSVVAPFLIRETSAKLLNMLREQYPTGKVFLEKRMDVTKETYTPKHEGLARNLKVEDAEALAQFFGAPPQAAGKFKGWLSGARAFMGVFENNELVSIGSSMVSIPESWNLVSIETRSDRRGKGYATEVTSALVEKALKETKTVTVTVVSDNLPAIRTYEKVGFAIAEDRIWFDNGTGAKP